MQLRKSRVTSAALAVALVVIAHDPRLEGRSSSNSNPDSDVAAIKAENAT